MYVLKSWEGSTLTAVRRVTSGLQPRPEEHSNLNEHYSGCIQLIAKQNYWKMCTIWENVPYSNLCILCLFIFFLIIIVCLYLCSLGEPCRTIPMCLDCRSQHKWQIKNLEPWTNMWIPNMLNCSPLIPAAMTAYIVCLRGWGGAPLLGPWMHLTHSQDDKLLSQKLPTAYTLYLADAFIQSDVQLYTVDREQFRVKCLAQGHID